MFWSSGLSNYTESTSIAIQSTFVGSVRCYPWYSEMQRLRTSKFYRIYQLSFDLRMRLLSTDTQGAAKCNEKYFLRSYDIARFSKCSGVQDFQILHNLPQLSFNLRLRLLSANTHGAPECNEKTLKGSQNVQEFRTVRFYRIYLNCHSIYADTQRALKCNEKSLLRC